MTIRTYCILLIIVCFLAFLASGVQAETIYLKDGSVIRGVIKSEDDKSLLIESGDSWKRVDKNNIEMVGKDAPIEKPAEVKPVSNVQQQQTSSATSKTKSDLRIKFGSSAGLTKLTDPDGFSLDFTGESSGNFQIEGNWGFYKESNVGFLLSAGLFSRQHSGRYSTTTIDYSAAGLSIGAGVGIMASTDLHFEGKLELGLGAGDASITTPGYSWNISGGGPYSSFSVILGAYYTISQPGMQIGIELGRQSFSGEFDYNSGAAIFTEKVEGEGTTANIVLGYRF